jgi:hypothetical protein
VLIALVLTARAHPDVVSPVVKTVAVDVVDVVRSIVAAREFKNKTVH